MRTNHFEMARWYIFKHIQMNTIIRCQLRTKIRRTHLKCCFAVNVWRVSWNDQIPNWYASFKLNTIIWLFDVLHSFVICLLFFIFRNLFFHIFTLDLNHWHVRLMWLKISFITFHFYRVAENDSILL